MSKTKSKNILGIFSILIMMHHLGQRTSAFWLPDDIRRPGLEVFVPIGYLLVAFFFFCSGYGLIKSLQTKEDYMKGFLVKRLNRILLVFVITEIIYLVFRTLYAVLELPANPYSWFVYAIVVLYVGFFFIYRRKNKFSLILMTIWVIGYSVICYLLVKGNWWINATPAFLVGIYMAEHERTGEEKICRSMIMNPEIIYADEPTGALNRTSAMEVMEAFLGINREGATIMMVTHDSWIASKCERIIYLLDGRFWVDLMTATS